MNVGRRTKVVGAAYLLATIMNTQDELAAQWQRQ